ncbi:hypothetical protein C9374_002975 [Naegleria lovaniensis]|uniref:Uncharacterized protein n=1 Tax=Naegleria lovaniensis TaxID=51637 RepID=A0AA88KLY2_NAELO|nr:uncharacterized protein C9374_002975 [Naegleria lovaniensis]KAG2385826.1 hypothetical protein C9374_002975 [Naegleria lovaniensis]
MVGLKALFKKKEPTDTKERRKSVAVLSSPRGVPPILVQTEGESTTETTTLENHNTKVKTPRRVTTAVVENHRDKQVQTTPPHHLAPGNPVNVERSPISSDKKPSRRRHQKRRKSIFDFFKQKKDLDEESDEEDDEDFENASNVKMSHPQVQALSLGALKTRTEDSSNSELEKSSQSHHEESQQHHHERTVSEERIALRRRSGRKSYTLAMDVQNMAMNGDEDAKLLLKFYKDAYTRESQIQKNKNVGKIVEDLLNFEKKKSVGTPSAEKEQNNSHSETTTSDEQQHHTTAVDEASTDEDSMTIQISGTSSTTTFNSSQLNTDEQSTTPTSTCVNSSTSACSPTMSNSSRKDSVSPSTHLPTGLTDSQLNLYQKLKAISEREEREREEQHQREIEERLKKQRELEAKMKSMLESDDSDLSEDDDETEEKSKENSSSIHPSSTTTTTTTTTSETNVTQLSNSDTNTSSTEFNSETSNLSDSALLLQQRRKQEELALEKLKQDQEQERLEQERIEKEKSLQLEQERIQRDLELKQLEETKRREADELRRKKLAEEEEERKLKQQIEEERSSLSSQLTQLLAEFNESGKLQEWIRHVESKMHLVTLLKSELKQAKDLQHNQTSKRTEYNSSLNFLMDKQKDPEKLLQPYEIELMKERVKNIYPLYLPKSEITKMEEQISQIENTEKKKREEHQLKLEQEAAEKLRKEKERQQLIILQRLIKDGNVKVISDELKRNNPLLRSVNLQNKNISNDEVYDLADALVENTCLTELDLSFNTRVDDECMDALVRIVKNNHTLRKLYLEDTFIQNNQPLIDAVASNFKLVDMVLSEFATDDQLDQLDMYLDRNEAL